MIVHELTKTIYLHNPKCGGTFLQKEYERHHPNYSFSLYWSLPNPETNLDTSHIHIKAIPRFFPDYKDYKFITFVRNPYNRFVSAIKTGAGLDGELNKVFSSLDHDPNKICKFLLAQNYRVQDSFLRNYSRPWFLPQSCYFDNSTIILKYESLADWQFIMNLFGMKDSQVRIAADKNVDPETCAMLRRLYFDDGILYKNL
ncbi:MAG: sulfotransferase family protein [Alistipes sp.]|nr:sulfotransferase family protein [Alistipes sp.]